MNKCVGCGHTLQSVSKLEAGYCLDLTNKYCQRCFRLMHYNDLVIDLKSAISKQEVFEAIKDIKATFVLVVDCLNLQASFSDDVTSFLDNKDVILIISKCDLLPKALNYERFFKELSIYIKDKFKASKLKEVILSSKNDDNFNGLFREVLRNHHIDKVCFIGLSNVGKSSLINKLLGHNLLTTSYFLTTTLKVNEVKVDDYTLIDTPGLVDEGNCFMHLDQDLLKRIIIKKPLKPKTYQFYENQSYFISDILRIDVVPIKQSSIVFYMNNDLVIHRTNQNKADNYEFKHEPRLLTYSFKDYVIKEKRIDLCIDGLGFISLYNVKCLKIKMHPKIKIELRRGLI